MIPRRRPWRLRRPRRRSRRRPARDRGRRSGYSRLPWIDRPGRLDEFSTRMERGSRSAIAYGNGRFGMPSWQAGGGTVGGGRPRLAGRAARPRRPWPGPGTIAPARRSAPGPQEAGPLPPRRCFPRPRSRLRPPAPPKGRRRRVGRVRRACRARRAVAQREARLRRGAAAGCKRSRSRATKMARTKAADAARAALAVMSASPHHAGTICAATPRALARTGATYVTE